VLVSIRALNNLARAKLTRFSTILEVIVITGFNTDIEHNGTVYHVQTEDKGLETPFILSLVYVGGAILASKRAPYDDLIGAGFDQTTLGERLQRQHKLICAAINAGRIEDLKRMSQRDTGQQPIIAAPALAVDQPNGDETFAARLTYDLNEPCEPSPIQPTPIQPTPIQPPTETHAATVEHDVSNAAIESDKIESDKIVAAPQEQRDAPVTEASEVAGAQATQAGGTLVAAAADVARALHERIEDRATEAVPVEIDDALHVELLGEKDYHAGEMVTLRVAVLRGAFGFREIVRDANVTVKVLGTEFRPLILTSKTDVDGLAVVHVWLPRFSKGRAAILVRANSDGCSAELRRIIHHN
jgi:hypothetical protein